MKVPAWLENIFALVVIGAWFIVGGMGVALTLAAPFIAWHFIGKYW